MYCFKINDCQLLAYVDGLLFMQKYDKSRCLSKVCDSYGIVLAQLHGCRILTKYSKIVYQQRSEMHMGLFFKLNNFEKVYWSIAVARFTPSTKTSTSSLVL